jgi:tetratricopeptide (TPR) repeat protein
LLLKTTTFKFILLAAAMTIAASDGIALTTARDYCNRAIARQRKGDLNGALADFDRAIKLNPQDEIAYNDRALAKMVKGDLDGALADYDRALQISPRDFKIRANRGVLRQRKGDLDGALDDYNIAIKLYRHFEFAYSSRATVKMAMNDLDGALADCNRAIALTHKDAAAYYTRALIKTAKGDLDAATADFNRAVKLNRKYARVRPPAANKKKVEPAGTPNENPGAGETDDFAAQSKAALDKVEPEPDHAPPIEVEPQNIAAIYDRNIAKRKNDHDNGAAAATSAEASNSSTPSNDVNVSKQNHDLSSPPIDQRGPAKQTAPNAPQTADSAEKSKTDSNIVLADRSRAAEPTALKPPEDVSVPTQKDHVRRDSADYQSPGEREPTTAVGYDDRARFKKSIGDLDGALADYNHAIQLDPKYAAAYNDRANVKRAKHDLDGALADYNHVIELSGDKAIAYYNRAVTKQAKGDLDGALADFNPAIQLDPKNALAYQNRGAVRAMKGDLDGALADYNRAIELNPKDAAAYNNRADLFFSVRNWDAALENYNRFLELSKEGQEYPRLYVWLILERTGQTDAANKELVDYLQQRPDTTDWFSKVAGYLLGRISKSDLLAAAKSSNEKKEAGQMCEAWFYIGMEKLIGGDKSAARDCFNKSLATNQKNYTEYYFSRAELKALRN